MVTYVCVAIYQETQTSVDEVGARLQSAGIFVTGIAVIISIIYLQISRRYLHQDRDVKLMTDLLAYVTDMFDYYGIRETHYLSTMRSCIGVKTGLKAFRIRFLLSVTPAVLGLIILVFNATKSEMYNVTYSLFITSLVIDVILMIQCVAYPRAHEKKYVIFSDAFVDSMARCGIRIKGYEPVIGFRPFIPFLILSIVTVGIFFLFWIFRSMADMDRHLEEQWIFENAIMVALRRY